MTLTARQFFLVERRQADPVVESQFFSNLKMRNGTFKLTQPSRFAALETEIGPALAERAAVFRQVLDVGASTGLTTIELMDFLRAAGACAEVTCTDLFVEAHLMEIAPGFRVLADADGWPLQYDVAGRPIRAWIRRLDYFTLMAALRLFTRAALRSRLRRMIAEGCSVAVRMESRDLADRNIELVENDIFAPTPSFIGRFDFIRAANILNLNYFPVEHIRHAISNIRSYCRGPRSQVLIARSKGSRHDATLFELGWEGAFTVRARAGSGSEIEGLVLGHQQKRP